MKERALILAVVVVAASCAVAVQAATITVDDSGGADFATIGQALIAAATGDTVLVADGTYTGPNNREMGFGGKNIVLASENGAAGTIIDCEDISFAFYITAGVDSTAAIQGFTITNSNGGISGGGIWVNDSNPKILDCVFTDCGNSYNGAAVELRNTPPALVRGCTFASNEAQYRGGCLAAIDGSVIILDCLFYDSSVNTTDQNFSYGGGAIYLDTFPGSAVVRNCTFVGNTSANGVSGSAIHHTEGDATIENCILSSGSGHGPVVGWCTVSHSVAFGNSPTDTLSCYHNDNLCVDPLFCEMAADDYTLCANSPCLPGSPQNPWGELVGKFGSGCGDCGSVVEPTTWGRIKGLYR